MIPLAVAWFALPRFVRTGAYVLLVLLAMGLGLKCYGDRREDQGERKARIAVADSVAAVYEVRAKLIADSAVAAIARAEIRADSAVRRARVAESQAADAKVIADAASDRYRQLPPAIVAGLSPEVARVLKDLDASNKALLASNAQLVATVRELTSTIDTMRASATLAGRALAGKDSALAMKDALITTLRGQQPKKPSRLKRYGSTALKVLAGAAAGYAIAQSRD